MNGVVVTVLRYKINWGCWTLLSWSWTVALSPPNTWSRQVATEPPAKTAANALSVAWICCTPLSWSWTAELSLPNYAPPQVIIVLSPWHHKAKAVLVAASCGWSTRTVRHCPSFLCDSSKVCSKLTKTRFSPVIILRCFCPKALGPPSSSLELRKTAKVTEAHKRAHSAKLPVHLLHVKSYLGRHLLTTFENISNDSPFRTLSPSQRKNTWSGDHATVSKRLWNTEREREREGRLKPN